MSLMLAALIVSDLKFRGMYFSEIMAMLKPERISMRFLGLTLCITAILCGLLTLAKFIILKYFLYTFDFSSEHMELFSGTIPTGNLHIFVSIIAYAFTCIFQEFIARSWLHDSFALIFTNNKKIPIIMTAGYFAGAHLHMTPYIAGLVFMLSIGWGILYICTNRSLYCVIISHAIVGIFAFNILGVPFQLVYGGGGA
jgi:hypothetical protein